jgi:Flp pilus assembly protein TadD
MKKTFALMAVIALTGLMVASCSSLKKMKKRANDITYAVTPETLTAKGGMVDLKIDITFPEKYFNRKVRVEATPVLRFNGGEKTFEMRALQGEKVIGNSEVIPFTGGKTITYTSQIPYEDMMRLSDLDIDIVGFKGMKSLAFTPRKIGSGVIATATLVDNRPSPMLGADNFQRVTQQQKEAAIYYQINSSELRNRETNSADIKALETYIKESLAAENTQVSGIDIRSYASPDGPLSLNERLADQREQGSTKFLKNRLKSQQALNALFNQYVVAEDWEGFQKAMESSDIQDKELILRVLSMYSDPVVREREIRNISTAFTAVADQILPKLRRSRFVVNTELTGKSDAELKSLAQSNPADLDVEELLYAATLFETPNDQLGIYRMVTRLYPNDWRGYNDIGIIVLESDNITEAKANFTRAASLSANNKIIQNNLGAVALREGDLKQASVYLGSATGAGAEVEYNKGILAIFTGDYPAAVRYLGSHNTPNSALANILAGNYNEASKRLATDNTALGHYLKAVIAARTNNAAQVLDNLKKAVALNPAYKQTAASDVEFARYFESAEFAAIVR